MAKNKRTCLKCELSRLCLPFHEVDTHISEMRSMTIDAWMLGSDSAIWNSVENEDSEKVFARQRSVALAFLASGCDFYKEHKDEQISGNS